MTGASFKKESLSTHYIPTDTSDAVIAVKRVAVKY
jgi:hypothetical protein